MKITKTIILKNMRVRLYNTTFNNILWAKIDNNTLIMSQNTLIEGVKEVRIPNVRIEDIQFMDNKIIVL